MLRKEIADLNLCSSDVRDAIRMVSEQHARMRASRRALKRRDAIKAANLYRLPFGNKSLEDGVARSRQDLQELLSRNDGRTVFS